MTLNVDMPFVHAQCYVDKQFTPHEFIGLHSHPISSRYSSERTTATNQIAIVDLNTARLIVRRVTRKGIPYIEEGGLDELAPSDFHSLITYVERNGIH